MILWMIPFLIYGQDKDNYLAGKRENAYLDFL